jgi:hypothetical protein
MAGNYQQGTPFFQNNIPPGQPDVTFSSSELEALAQHRKRYLASANMYMGFPVDIMSIGQQPNGTSAAYQSSTKEETTYAYQKTSSEVGFSLRHHFSSTDLFRNAARPSKGKAAMPIMVAFAGRKL